MKRFAFKMKLKPGCEKEYEQRHAAIWPELVDMIHQQGVSNYSIYWDKETNLLFAYQECAGEGSSQDTSAVDPITQKWWDMVANESAKGIAQAANYQLSKWVNTGHARATKNLRMRKPSTPWKKNG